MQEREETIYPYGKFRLFFNVLILISSISLMLFMILVWGIWNYLIVLSYVLSTFVSFSIFYYLKLVLLKGLSSDVMESVEVHRSDRGPERRRVLRLFVVILLVMAMPLIVLFLIPDLWLVILNGILSGAAVSDLVLYLKIRR